MKSPNTAARTAALQALAAEILAASGIDVTTATPPETLRGLYRQLAEIAPCHPDTAKRHVARAMRRKRHPDYKPPQHGGARDGAGRPPKQAA